MATVDVRGLACPAPLIKTKKAIENAEAGSAIQVVGDGDIPLGNLKNYLRELGIPYKEMPVDNQEWILTFRVPEAGKAKSESVQAETFCAVPEAASGSAMETASTGSVAKTAPNPQTAPTGSAENGSYVIAVSSLCMGNGDADLGSLLMKSFLNVLPELSRFPQTICFYNEGVKLACTNSPVLESLRILQDKGVELVVCGTCVEYFGLKDEIAVGKISNMYHIAGILTSATKVVQP